MRGIKLFKLLEGNLFETRVGNTLQYIKEQLKNYKVVKFTFYINSANNEDYIVSCSLIKEIINSIFKNNIPAITFVSSTTINNDDLTIECNYTGTDYKVNYKKILNHNYVTITHHNDVELISGGIQFSEDSPLMNIQRAFDFTEQILMAEEMNFGHIFKQWNYIPDILKNATFNGAIESNYIIFNQIKGLFLEDALLKKGYAIETLTGTRYGHVTIDFMAFSNYEKIISLSKDIKDSTQAKLIEMEIPQIWFNSTTSLAIEENDVEQLTLNSFENIFSIIEKQTKDFNKHFQLLKLYIKNSADISIIKGIAKKLLPEIDIILINTPLHKEDVLLQIEGVYYKN